MTHEPESGEVLAKGVEPAAFVVSSRHLAPPLARRSNAPRAWSSPSAADMPPLIHRPANGQVLARPRHYASVPTRSEASVSSASSQLQVVHGAHVSVARTRRMPRAHDRRDSLARGGQHVLDLTQSPPAPRRQAIMGSYRKAGRGAAPCCAVTRHKAKLATSKLKRGASYRRGDHSSENPARAVIEIPDRRHK